MKYFLVLLVTFLSHSLFAQGIDFFHGSWEEALELSKKEGKPIFVDAYAKWCGPCKRMAATTFKDKKVGEFFNQNFINVKMDCEEPEGISFRRKYPVSAYPTLYFIDEKGEVIHSSVGGKDVNGILKLAEFALSQVDYSREYAKEYENGNREPELIYNYVKALNRSNKSSLRVSNEYLRSQEDLTTPFNLRFILEAAVEADSRIFGLLIKYQKEIAQLEGYQKVKDRIALACSNTVKKAIEFESSDLLEEAIAKMKEHYPEKAKAFEADAKRKFYLAANDAKAYLDACDDCAKLAGDENADDLAKLAEEMMNSFSDNNKCKKLAEKYARQAAKTSSDYNHWLLYSRILLTNGKKDDAVEAAEKALELARLQEDKEAIHALETFIRHINS
ncbi:MAG: thioredoxin [Saprospirales bacterium]|nr:thioredoxin [Saprospirales bacterium]